MKTLSLSIAIGLGGLLTVGTLPSRGDLEVSAAVNIHATADFHAPLAPHGTWVEVDTYGRCWRPARVAVGWRPYVVGHWEWTDCGWYWFSDEPWAWACYHYGSWVHHSHHGWMWVPGIEWAPAWVTWRVGGGYIGWAPLPPHHARVAVTVGAPHFVFVQSARFHDRHARSTVIVNNTKIINETTVINNIKREDRIVVGGGKPQKVVINEGPGIETVQKATGKTFKPAPIREVAERAPIPAEVRRQEKSRAKPESIKPDSKPPPGTEKIRPHLGKEIGPSPGNPPKKNHESGGKGKGPK